MKTHTFANIIIYDLSTSAHLRDSFENSGNVISQMVDDWDKNIYTIPQKALQIRREKQQENFMM